MYGRQWGELQGDLGSETVKEGKAGRKNRIGSEKKSERSPTSV